MRGDGLQPGLRPQGVEAGVEDVGYRQGPASPKPQVTAPGTRTFPDGAKKQRFRTS